MAKRYKLPPMKRHSNLIRVARGGWIGGRTMVKAIWVTTTLDAAYISRATRRLSILPSRSFPKAHVHLRRPEAKPSEKRAAAKQ